MKSRGKNQTHSTIQIKEIKPISKEGLVTWSPAKRRFMNFSDTYTVVSTHSHRQGNPFPHSILGYEKRMANHLAMVYGVGTWEIYHSRGRSGWKRIARFRITQATNGKYSYDITNARRFRSMWFYGGEK